MTYKITEIEGIGPSFADKLAAAEITNTNHLLAKCGDAKGRKAVAATTGIDAARLLKWANMADLMRIKGVGKQFAELLEAAGVDTIKELRHRNAENLSAAMAEINEKKRLARTSASTASVIDWVEQAKALEPKISH